MKRRTKLFLLLTSLLTLGLVGVVLRKIEQNAGMPFSGAVVVLDDASWRARRVQDKFHSGYIWETLDTILYQQEVANGSRVVLRQVKPNRTASPPQVLPVLLRPGQDLCGLSPHGRILCLHEFVSLTSEKYTLIQLDGHSKPVTFVSSGGSSLFWSSDSTTFSQLAYEKSLPSSNAIIFHLASLQQLPSRPPRD